MNDIGLLNQLPPPCRVLSQISILPLKNNVTFCEPGEPPVHYMKVSYLFLSKPKLF